MKFWLWRLKCLYVDIRQWIKPRLYSPGIYVVEIDGNIPYGIWAANYRYEKGYMPHPGDVKDVYEWQGWNNGEAK